MQSAARSPAHTHCLHCLHCSAAHPPRSPTLASFFASSSAASRPPPAPVRRSPPPSALRRPSFAMGKRKSKARVMKKERAAVDTIFDCPFCAHKQTVECKMSDTYPACTRRRQHARTKQRPRSRIWAGRCVHICAMRAVQVSFSCSCLVTALYCAPVPPRRNYTTNLGNIKCRVCAVSFQSDIHRQFTHCPSARVAVVGYSILHAHLACPVGRLTD